MEKMTVFDNEDFGKVRVVGIENEPWFVGKDVAEALGYERGGKAIVDHVDEEDRLMVDGKTQSQFGIELGQRGGWLINESGVYSLILSSKLPKAKEFKRWVTAEVLPTMRKTGGYVTDDALFVESYFGDADEATKKFMTAILAEKRKSAQKVKELSDKIEKDATDVSFAQAIKGGKGDILIGELAKLITAAGVKIGRNALFADLRTNGYLCKYGDSYNFPSARAVKAGWMKFKESYHYDTCGRVRVDYTPIITPKGQHYFLNLYSKANRYKEGAEG